MTTFYLKAAIYIQFNRPRIELMLFFKDPSGKSILLITRQNRYRILQDNRPAVHAFIDKVNRTARHLYTVGQNIPMGMSCSPNSRIS